MKTCGGTDNWLEIAKLVGYGVRGEQCRLRWHNYVNPELQKCERGGWTDKEVCFLMTIEKISEYIF